MILWSVHVARTSETLANSLQTNELQPSARLTVTRRIVPHHPATDRTEMRMIDENTKKEILDSITKYGKTEAEELNVNTNIGDVVTFSSGSPRIQRTVTRKATLILGQPKELKDLSNVQIRCVLCNRVISYPAWYYKVEYAINRFHYFICFDAASIAQPTARCYRRD